MERCLFGRAEIGLPAELADDLEVFLEVVNYSTWKHVLDDNEKRQLARFLPSLPQEAQREQNLVSLFSGENFKFGNPLHQFHRKLREGRFSSEIAKYMELIKKARYKEYRNRQEIYFTKMLKEVIVNRQRLLAAAASVPPGEAVRIAWWHAPSQQMQITPIKQERGQRLLNCMELAVCKKYRTVIKEINEECGLEDSSSEEEDVLTECLKDPQYSEALQQLEYFQPSVFGTLDERPKHINGGKLGRPSKRPISPLFMNDKTTYAKMIARHKKRRLENEDAPDLNTGNTTMEDVIARAYGRPVGRPPKNDKSGEKNKAKRKRQQHTKHDGSLPALWTPPREEDGDESSLVMDVNEEQDSDTENIQVYIRRQTYGAHASFFSVLREFIVEEKLHKISTFKIEQKVCDWQKSQCASSNPWFTEQNSWSDVTIAALSCMAGFTTGLKLENFVPLLDYKERKEIWKWIGDGRDTDSQLKPLCEQWLTHVKLVGPSVQRADGVKTPPPRCTTDYVVKPAEEEEIEVFREQETLRFESPHEAFTYDMHGYESVVGPIKGVYDKPESEHKARDHALLVKERPSYATILTLVRDAAARLPNGVGTRADICEMLKYSQYLTQDATETLINSVVSGALDRLQYEKDPCLKYSASRKLWIYLHRNRSEQDFNSIHETQAKLAKAKQSLKPTATKKSKEAAAATVAPVDVSMSGDSSETPTAAAILSRAPESLRGLYERQQALYLQRQQERRQITQQPRIITVSGSNIGQPVHMTSPQISAITGVSQGPQISAIRGVSQGPQISAIRGVSPGLGVTVTGGVGEGLAAARLVDVGSTTPGAMSVLGVRHVTPTGSSVATSAILQRQSQISGGQIVLTGGLNTPATSKLISVPVGDRASALAAGTRKRAAIARQLSGSVGSPSASPVIAQRVSTTQGRSLIASHLLASASGNAASPAQSVSGSVNTPQSVDRTVSPSQTGAKPGPAFSLLQSSTVSKLLEWQQQQQQLLQQKQQATIVVQQGTQKPAPNRTVLLQQQTTRPGSTEAAVVSASSLLRAQGVTGRNQQGLGVVTVGGRAVTTASHMIANAPAGTRLVQVSSAGSDGKPVLARLIQQQPGQQVITLAGGQKAIASSSLKTMQIGAPSPQTVVAARTSMGSGSNRPLILQRVSATGAATTVGSGTAMQATEATSSGVVVSATRRIVHTVAPSSQILQQGTSKSPISDRPGNTNILQVTSAGKPGAKPMIVSATGKTIVMGSLSSAGTTEVATSANSPVVRSVQTTIGGRSVVPVSTNASGGQTIQIGGKSFHISSHKAVHLGATATEPSTVSLSASPVRVQGQQMQTAVRQVQLGSQSALAAAVHQRVQVSSSNLVASGSSPVRPVLVSASKSSPSNSASSGMPGSSTVMLKPGSSAQVGSLPTGTTVVQGGVPLPQAVVQQLIQSGQLKAQQPGIKTVAVTGDKTKLVATPAGTSMQLQRFILQQSPGASTGTQNIQLVRTVMTPGSAAGVKANAGSGVKGSPGTTLLVAQASQGKPIAMATTISPSVISQQSVRQISSPTAVRTLRPASGSLSIASSTTAGDGSTKPVYARIVNQSAAGGVRLTAVGASGGSAVTSGNAGIILANTAQRTVQIAHGQTLQQGQRQTPIRIQDQGQIASLGQGQIRAVTAAQLRALQAVNKVRSPNPGIDQTDGK